MTSPQPTHILPVLPLRDIVVFPHMIVPLFVGRERSVHALEEVMADNKQILLLTQVDASTEDPEANEMFKKIQKSYEVLSNPISRQAYDIENNMNDGADGH